MKKDMKYWLKLALKYYEKASIVKEEAEKDLKIGAWNKAVSASYFMLEMLANALFALKKQKTTGFMGRVSLIKQLLGKDIASEFLLIHEKREKADHKEKIFSKEEALEIFNKAIKFYHMLKNLVEKELEKVKNLP